MIYYAVLHKPTWYNRYRNDTINFPVELKSEYFNNPKAENC